jgi:cobalamin biosynthesis protein CobW
VVTLGEVNEDKIKDILAALITTQNIYRAKGFAALPGMPMRQVLQAVGRRLDVHFDRLWTVDETRATSLVFIGKGLVEADIKAALQKAEVVNT